VVANSAFSAAIDLIESACQKIFRAITLPYTIDVIAEVREAHHRPDLTHFNSVPSLRGEKIDSEWTFIKEHQAGRNPISQQ